jgi:tetratricopeptide (TPR) repeat protein
VRWVICLGWASLVCALSGLRHASAGEPVEGGSAAAHLARGNEAFKQGRFAEAERAYRAAFERRRGYDIAGNLGAAELAQGKHKEAAEHLAFTLRLFPITGDPALRGRMARAFESARREVGALQIATSQKGAVVTVDGVPRGESPLADEVFVDPGDHVVDASLDGFESTRQGVTVEKGGSAIVTVPLAPIVRERIRIVDSSPPPRPRSALPAIIMGTSGLVAITAGIVLVGVSTAKAGHASSVRTAILAGGESCVAGADNHDEARCPDLKRALRAKDALRNAGVGAIALGAAAGVGVAAYLLWPRRPRDRTGLRVAPIVGQRGSAVVVSGTF